MKLEDLILSKRCLREFKNSGFENLDEFIDFIEGYPIATYSMSMKCLNEMMDKLVVLGLLSKERWGNPPQ